VTGMSNPGSAGRSQGPTSRGPPLQNRVKLEPLLQRQLPPLPAGLYFVQALSNHRLLAGPVGVAGQGGDRLLESLERWGDRRHCHFSVLGTIASAGGIGRIRHVGWEIEARCLAHDKARRSAYAPGFDIAKNRRPSVP